MSSETNPPIKDSVFYNPSFFHNDRDILLLYQKIERIFGAVFLISRYIEHTHVLKRTIEDSATVLFKACVDFITDNSISIHKLKTVSIHLINLYAHLDTAFWAGVVSQMNASIIQKEVRVTIELASKLDEKYKNLSNPQNSFMALLEKESSISSTEPATVKDNIKDIINKGQKPFRSPLLSDTNNLSSGGANEERVHKIKALLRDFKPRTIKDIAAIFSDVSEKTIQREMTRLINRGAIKRIGDRRWSTYILV